MELSLAWWGTNHLHDTTSCQTGLTRPRVKCGRADFLTWKWRNLTTNLTLALTLTLTLNKPFDNQLDICLHDAVQRVEQPVNFYASVITSQYVRACQPGIGTTITNDIWLNLPHPPCSTDITFSAWNRALHAWRIPCDMYLTSVSHLGWPSRAMHLGGLGLIRTSP